MIRKSGITIKQCAQSFRIIQILSNYGITDELDSSPIPSSSGDLDDKIEESLLNKKKTGKRKKVYPSTSRYNFYYFIESIYNNCKKHGIGSTNIIQWMYDLLEFDPSLTENVRNALSGLEKDTEAPMELQKSEMSKKSVSGESQATLSDREIQIPFISKINNCIQQKKLKAQNLDTYSKKLQQKIRDLEEQRNIMDSRITNLKRNESISLAYLDWYKSLRLQLFDLYQIKLEEEVSSFVNIFADFKYYNYNAHQIVKEYKQIESIRDKKNP